MICSEIAETWGLFVCLLGGGGVLGGFCVFFKADEP